MPFQRFLTIESIQCLAIDEIVSEIGKKKENQNDGKNCNNKIPELICRFLVNTSSLDSRSRSNSCNTLNNGGSDYDQQQLQQQQQKIEDSISTHFITRPLKDVLILSERLIDTFDVLLSRSRGGPSPLTRKSLHLSRSTFKTLMNINNGINTPSTPSVAEKFFGSFRQKTNSLKSSEKDANLPLSPTTPSSNKRSRSNSKTGINLMNNISMNNTASTPNWDSQDRIETENDKISKLRRKAINDFFRVSLNVGGEVVASSRAMQDFFLKRRDTNRSNNSDQKVEIGSILTTNHDGKRISLELEKAYFDYDDDENECEEDDDDDDRASCKSSPFNNTNINKDGRTSRFAISNSHISLLQAESFPEYNNEQEEKSNLQKIKIYKEDDEIEETVGEEQGFEKELNKKLTMINGGRKIRNSFYLSQNNLIENQTPKPKVVRRVKTANGERSDQRMEFQKEIQRRISSNSLNKVQSNTGNARPFSPFESDFNQFSTRLSPNLKKCDNQQTPIKKSINLSQEKLFAPATRVRSSSVSSSRSIPISPQPSTSPSSVNNEFSISNVQILTAHYKKRVQKLPQCDNPSTIVTQTNEFQRPNQINPTKEYGNWRAFKETEDRIDWLSIHSREPSIGSAEEEEGDVKNGVDELKSLREINQTLYQHNHQQKDSKPIFDQQLQTFHFSKPTFHIQDTEEEKVKSLSKRLKQGLILPNSKPAFIQFPSCQTSPNPTKTPTKSWTKTEYQQDDEIDNLFCDLIDPKLKFDKVPISNSTMKKLTTNQIQQSKQSSFISSSNSNLPFQSKLVQNKIQKHQLKRREEQKQKLQIKTKEIETSQQKQQQQNWSSQDSCVDPFCSPKTSPTTSTIISAKFSSSSSTSFLAIDSLSTQNQKSFNSLISDNATF